MTERQSPTPQEDFGRLWAQLVAETWADDELRERLLSDPMTVMEERGISIPPDQEVRVVQNTEGVVYLPLPAKPPEVVELSEEDLSQAVAGRKPIGGACGNDTCSVTYFPIRSRPPQE